MNRYLMRIEGYFSGWKQFEIEAENKRNAIVKAKEAVDFAARFTCFANF